jgi:hypothetical protein
MRAARGACAFRCSSAADSKRSGLPGGYGAILGGDAGSAQISEQ